ncbi:aldo-keto reductase family 1 member A1-like isoform X2 [Mytilus galloprovincialis]|uniref:aldo-keto reductase family 1 member A1-like isoform X2 n=1 Tax=Mytilus galloprovincialis TaxID=29158 RepID=UPI003F7C4F8F
MADSFVLSNGQIIPGIGFGTSRISQADMRDVIFDALESGYRHFDTAHAYRTESALGEALQDAIIYNKVSRSELYITTKLPTYHMRKDHVVSSLRESLKNLRIDYIDLYLVHVPASIKVESEYIPYPSCSSDDYDYPDIIDTWREMEKLVDAGLARAIGLSNFNASQVERIDNNARIKPVVNQIECHAYLQQNKLVDVCKRRNISVTAYAPLGSPGLQIRNNGRYWDLFEEPVILKIAKCHQRTPAQICLRHLLQRGLILIPKTENTDRMRLNLEIKNFSLTKQEMEKLSKLDSNKRIFSFNGMKDHPEYPFKDPY